MMPRIRRAFRKRRALFLVALIIAFLAVNVALGWYITNHSTAEMPSDSFGLGSEVQSVDRSAKGYVYVLDEQVITRLAWFGSQSYPLASRPTSMEVGLESDALVVAAANDSVNLFWSESEKLEWWRSMNGTPTVIALSERGTQFGYNPDTAYVLTENATGRALVGLNCQRWGREVMNWPFDASVVSVAHSLNTHYLALGFDNSSVAVFSKDRTSPIGLLQVGGEVAEMAFSSSGGFMALLCRQGPESQVVAYSLPTLSIMGQVTFQTDSARNLRVHGDRTAIYLQEGDQVWRWDLEAGTGPERYLAIDGLVDYVFPSIGDWLFASSPGRVESHVPGLEVAKWASAVGGGAPQLLTDAGGWQVVGYDDSRLLLMDNTRDYSGSRALWTLFGALLIVELLVIFAVLYWRRLRELRAEAVIALGVGAFAGVLVAAALPDPAYVDWMGDMIVYLVVSAAVAAVCSLVARESQAGLGGIVLGTVLGIPLAMTFSLVAAFCLWATGYHFGETEEIFVTVAISLPMGFKMGLAGSVTGALLSRIGKAQGQAR